MWKGRYAWKPPPAPPPPPTKQKASSLRFRVLGFRVSGSPEIGKTLLLWIRRRCLGNGEIPKGIGLRLPKTTRAPAACRRLGSGYRRYSAFTLYDLGNLKPSTLSLENPKNELGKLERKSQKSCLQGGSQKLPHACGEPLPEKPLKAPFSEER